MGICCNAPAAAVKLSPTLARSLIKSVVLVASEPNPAHTIFAPAVTALRGANINPNPEANPLAAPPTSLPAPPIN